MKRLYPILIAIVVFIVALILMQPEGTTPVVIAAGDLDAGRTLSANDLEIQRYPRSMAPDGALSSIDLLVGQVLAVPRSAGDVIYPSQLGGEKLALAANERAIAIQVADSAGLAGLLRPGDRVGITAVIFSGGSGTSGGAFSKTIIEGLRVLYISPDFYAVEPAAVKPTASSDDESGRSSSSISVTTSSSSTSKRASSGTIVLAVPTDAQVVAYDFSAFGVESSAVLVNVVDLLPALDHATNISLSLFLVPDDPRAFVTSGLYLPNLVITPGPSPTPTLATAGAGGSLAPGVTPTPNPASVVP